MRAGRARRWSTLVAATAAVAAAGAGTAIADTTGGDGVSTRIVGGERASIEDYPWAVYLTTPAGQQFCGGSLVAADKVVTAAHCTEDSAPSDIRVVAGREDKNSTDGDEAEVTDIWINPDYDSTSFSGDVSVLTLDVELDHPTVPLATPADEDLHTPGEAATVVGWGTTSSGGAASRYLLETTVPLVSAEDCASAYGGEFDEATMLCAGLEEGGKDACQGDSGGPLVVEGTLVGVVSWGYGCAQAGYPGVYAGVAAHSDQLAEQIAS
ncbi:serine protease [Actinoalloteichus sp. AHMU CJ021]|uniref:Trypsin n=1 Tax=Actinoalloteichus caeruleus DSM 43889 TaxID=1120930 RepID=A0ABT1JD75_ACTCY|nr:serine protease [Actinoalloteichus caeruleus]AUS79500.1 serine protease [Actinoalloteichus sp. AHMU CJ021]MCP2329741.1 Trypsin [Actinoalloteichus caeruleus DSM 43889]